MSKTSGDRAVRALPPRTFKYASRGPIRVARTESHALHRHLVGRTVWHYEALESTNDAAKEALGDELPEGLVIVADRQVAGRGRHGRSWASPPGGLYFSMVLRPKDAAHAALLGLLMGQPVVKALRHFGVLAQLKWPNDVVYQGRKIAGILSEGVHRHDVFYAIVGIGVNTNLDLERLPEDVRGRATSLRREVSLYVANEEFLDYTLDQADLVYSRYLNTPPEILLRDYRGLCATIGRRVRVTAGRERLEGRAYDLAPSGALIVVDDVGAKHEVLDGTVEHLS